MSKAVDIAKGVLQRKVLNPTFFTVFIADLEEFLNSKGITGVSTDHLTEILLLAYADDLALLADSLIGMKRILIWLFSYCQLNDLEVNINRTKIIIFKKGEHIHNKNYPPTESPLIFFTTLPTSNSKRWTTGLFDLKGIAQIHKNNCAIEVIE